MGWRDLFSSRVEESPFSVPQNQEPNTLGLFSYFDFSKTEEKDIYLICATPESADNPVLVKVRCKCEVHESRYLKYIFSCAVVEIEGDEFKGSHAVERNEEMIPPEAQMRVLHKALLSADIDGNPIKVSANYIDHHLRLVRIRKEIQTREVRKGVENVSA